MKVFIEKDYESMSEKAACEVLKILTSEKNPLLCPATGDSPKGLYRNLIKRINEDHIDTSGWYFVGLDEWVGMNEDDEGSCRFHLDNDLLKPLNVQAANVCFFDGKADDLQKEIKKTGQFIKDHNGIYLAIVGLGLNGHIGMNEPGTDSSLHAHISEIDTITQEAGQKYFTTPRQISKGITLGIKDIMEAQNVILLVSGNKKAAICRDILEGDISPLLPASFLLQHKNFSVYLDEDAASLLQKK